MKILVHSSECDMIWLANRGNNIGSQLKLAFKYYYYFLIVCNYYFLIVYNIIFNCSCFHLLLLRASTFVPKIRHRSIDGVLHFSNNLPWSILPAHFFMLFPVGKLTFFVAVEHDLTSAASHQFIPFFPH